MHPNNLIKQKQYHYRRGDQTVTVTYSYETLNCWLFYETVYSPIILLHQQQVIALISEI